MKLLWWNINVSFILPSVSHSNKNNATHFSFCQSCCTNENKLLIMDMIGFILLIHQIVTRRLNCMTSTIFKNIKTLKFYINNYIKRVILHKIVYKANSTPNGPHSQNFKLVLQAFLLYCW